RYQVQRWNSHLSLNVHLRRLHPPVFSRLRPQYEPHRHRNNYADWHAYRNDHNRLYPKQQMDGYLEDKPGSVRYMRACGRLLKRNTVCTTQLVGDPWLFGLFCQLMQAIVFFTDHAITGKLIKAGHAIDIGMNLIFLTQNLRCLDHFTQNDPRT